MKTVIYAYDPMCSWCYGFAPTLREIQKHLPADVQFEYLLGGLAPDDDVPMPQAMADKLAATWHRIESQCGVSFDHTYWQQSPLPPRTTFIAGRAVLAAERQHTPIATTLEAIQVAYYKNARNVWSEHVLAEIAGELGLDENLFRADLEAVRDAHDNQLQRTYQLGVQGFPTLIWQDDQRVGQLPIQFGNATTTTHIINQVAKDGILDKPAIGRPTSRKVGRKAVAELYEQELKVDQLRDQIRLASERRDYRSMLTLSSELMNLCDAAMRKCYITIQKN